MTWIHLNSVFDHVFLCSLPFYVKLAGQEKHTDSGYPMWGLQLPSILESKGIRCCWSRWKALTHSKTPMIPLTFIWDSPTLSWLQLINRLKITTLLSQHVSPHRSSQQPPFSITVALELVFLVLLLVVQQLRWIGLLSKPDLSGTSLFYYFIR